MSSFANALPANVRLAAISSNPTIPPEKLPLNTRPRSRLRRANRRATVPLQSLANTRLRANIGAARSLTHPCGSMAGHAFSILLVLEEPARNDMQAGDGPLLRRVEAAPISSLLAIDIAIVAEAAAAVVEQQLPADLAIVGHVKD